jgi:hypothetical protein
VPWFCRRQQKAGHYIRRHELWWFWKWITIEFPWWVLCANFFLICWVACAAIVYWIVICTIYQSAKFTVIHICCIRVKFCLHAVSIYLRLLEMVLSSCHICLDWSVFASNFSFYNFLKEKGIHTGFFPQTWNHA